MGSTVPPAPSPSPAGSRSVGGGCEWDSGPCHMAPQPLLGRRAWRRRGSRAQLRSGHPRDAHRSSQADSAALGLAYLPPGAKAPVHTAHRTCSSCPTGHHAPFQALSTASTPDHLVPLAGSVQERVGSDGPLDTLHRPLPSRDSQHLPRCPGGSACGCCPCPRGHAAPALLATPSVRAAAPGRFLHHCPFPYW